MNLMVPNTRARDALAAKLGTPPRTMTVTEFARRIGCGRLVVYAWLRRRQRPGMLARHAIEREVDIPHEDWMTDAERTAVSGRSPKAA